MRCEKCGAYNPEELKYQMCHACGMSLKDGRPSSIEAKSSPAEKETRVSAAATTIVKTSKYDALYGFTLFFGIVLGLFYLMELSSEYYLKNVRGSFVDALIWGIQGPLTLLTAGLLFCSAIALHKESRRRPAFLCWIVLLFVLVLPVFGAPTAMLGHAVKKLVSAKTSKTDTLLARAEGLKKLNQMYFGSAEEKELELRQPQLLSILKDPGADYEKRKLALKYLKSITDEVEGAVLATATAILEKEPKYYDFYYGWPLEKIASSKLSSKEKIFKSLEKVAVEHGVNAYIIEHIRSFQSPTAQPPDPPDMDSEPIEKRRADDQALAMATRLLKAGQYRDAVARLEALQVQGGYIAHSKRFQILEMLVDGYERQKLWEKAIYYHKEWLESVWGSQGINRNIVKLYKLQSEYARNGGTDPGILSEEIPVNYSALRRHVRGFGWYASEIMAIDQVSSYFYTKLRFDAAEHYAKLAISVLDERKRSGGIIKDADTSPFILHETLRDLYMIRGRYSDALKEHELMWADSTNNSPYSVLMREHEKSILVYLVRNPIASEQITYNQVSQFEPRFELNQSGWRTYAQKADELRATIERAKAHP